MSIYPYFQSSVTVWNQLALGKGGVWLTYTTKHFLVHTQGSTTQITTIPHHRSHDIWVVSSTNTQPFWFLQTVEMWNTKLTFYIICVDKHLWASVKPRLTPRLQQTRGKPNETHHTRFIWKEVSVLWRQNTLSAGITTWWVSYVRGHLTMLQHQQGRKEGLLVLLISPCLRTHTEGTLLSTYTEKEVYCNYSKN